MGATVVTQVFGGSARAVIGDGLTAFTAKDAAVTADTDDEVLLIAISFGGGGSVGVGVGASVLVFENETRAAVGGSIRSGGSITVSAASSTKLLNTAAAAAVGGSVAASPVVIVTYFQGNTAAELSDGSKLIAVGAVMLCSVSDEAVTAAAAGASVSGGAAVSGTVSVAVTKLRTAAVAGDGAVMQGSSVSVLADDSMSILSTVGSISVSGEASVGVTAAVNIIKNTVTASVGAGGSLRASAGNVEVRANAVRELASYAVTAAGAGVAGVGVTIMVDVIGAKLSKDAADGLMYREYTEDGKTKNNGGLDIGKLTKDLSGQPDASSSLTRLSLTEDLTPDNGDSVKDYQVGDETGVDVTTGYKDENLDSADGSGSEGESYAADGAGNSDLTQAADVGQVKRAYDPMDAVCALVGANTLVEAVGDISIEASDLITVDAVAGTVAVGGTAGVGAGLALVISYSNVIARAESGAVLDAGGTVTVKAVGSSVEVSGDSESTAAKDTGAGLAEQLERAVTGHGIRAVSITAAGGIVGVSVSAAVVTLNSSVIAELNGSVKNASALSVMSVTEHENILAVTLAASGGAVSVSVPVAVVRSVGEALAGIGGSGSITAAGAVSVNGRHTLKALAAAASFGAGTVSVNASLPLAINRMTGHTYIGRGVSVDAQSVNVETAADTSAVALLVGVSIAGNTSVGVGVAIAIDEAKLYTYLGETPTDDKRPAASALRPGLIRTRGALTVSNAISSQALPDILYFSGGSLNITANVLLAFNRLDAVAAINKINVDAGGDIAVSAAMNAEASAQLYKGSVGGLSAGATVAYAQMRAANRAMIDLTGVIVKGAGALSVRAGSSARRNSAYASAETTSADISVASACINAAVADNCAKNAAIISGSGTLSLVGALTAESFLYSAANAALTGLNISGLRVTVGAVIANDRTENTADVYADALTAAGLSVRAERSAGKYSSAASADITQGLGTLDASLAEAAVNVAMAYARSVNTARAGGASVKLGGGVLSVRSAGSAKAAVSIRNLSSVDLSYISVGAMLGLAYSQGQFNALLELGGGSVVEARSVEVITDYSAAADASVQPSTGGIRISAVSVDINLAVAAVTTQAKAAILRTGSGGVRPTVKSDSDLNVLSKGAVSARAAVTTADLSFGGVNIGVNLVFARAAGDQLAQLRNVGVTAAGSVTVSSDVNRAKAGSVEATVGAAGGKEVNVSAMSGKMNAATAVNKQQSSALAELADISAGDTLTIIAVGDVSAKADVETPTLSLTLVNVALNAVAARVESRLKATLDLTTAAVTAPRVLVKTDYLSDALAEVAPSGSVSGSLSYKSADANTAISRVTAAANSNILGGGSLSSSDSVQVITAAAGGAVARHKRVSFDLSVYNVSMNYTQASVSDSLCANIRDDGVYTLNNVNVQSVYSGSGADAETGGAVAAKSENASARLIGASANTADARAKIENRAYIYGGMTMSAKNVKVYARSSGTAQAKALSYKDSFGGVSIGSLVAKGTVVGTTTADFGGGSFRIAGDVTVEAYDAPNLYLKSQLPGKSISGIEFNTTTVDGSIGTASSPNTVRARLRENTTLNIAAGNLSVRAYNKPGGNTLIIDNGGVVALADITVSSLSSETRLSTEASLGENSQLLVFGRVTVSAEDKPVADNRALGSTVGIGLSADMYYASNSVYSTVKVMLGNGLTLTARGDISILAKTSAQLTAITDSDANGAFTGGKLTAKNNVTRLVTVTAPGTAELCSLSGDVSLRTSSGESDNIVTKTLDSSKALLSVYSVEAVTNVDVDHAIDLENGFKAIAYVGDVRLENAVNINKLVNYAESKTGAGFAYQRAEARTGITVNSQIIIGRQENTLGATGLANELQGYNVWLLNWLESANVDNQIHVKNSGFTGHMDPFCRIDLNFEKMVIHGYRAAVYAYEKYHQYNVGYDKSLHSNNDVKLYNYAFLDLPAVSLDWLTDAIKTATTDKDYNADVYTRVQYEFDTFFFEYYLFRIAETLHTGFYENLEDGSKDRFVMTSEIYYDVEFMFDMFGDSYYKEWNSFIYPKTVAKVDGYNFWLKRLDLEFAKPGTGPADSSALVTPVIIYFYQDSSGTPQWKVANSVHNIGFTVDADQRRIVLGDLRQNDKYGYFWTDHLIADFTIINDTDYDLELNDISFRSPVNTDELWASARVRVVSTGPTDVHYCGTVEQVNGRYRVFEYYDWLDEYGTIYVGRQQSDTIIINSDTDITKPDGVTVEVTADGYVITGLKLNADQANFPTAEYNAKHKYVWYEGIDLKILNNTAKSLIIEGIGGNWTDEVQFNIDNEGSTVTISSFGGGSVQLNGQINTESFTALWVNTAGDLIFGRDAELRTRSLTVDNARNVRGTAADGGAGRAVIWVMSGDTVSVGATGDIALEVNVRGTRFRGNTYIDRLEAGGTLYARLVTYNKNDDEQSRFLNDYYLSGVKGRSVTLDLGRSVNLVSGGSTMDIEALEDLTIYTRCLDTINEFKHFGTAADPLEIKVGGRLLIAQHSDDPLIAEGRKASYSLYLNVPQGELDMSGTELGSEGKYNEWCAVVVSVPNGSLKLGNISYFIDELTLTAGGDITTGVLLRSAEGGQRTITAGGSITVGAADYTLYNTTYSGSVIDPANSGSAQPTQPGFVLTAGGDVVFMGQVTVTRALSVTAGRDIILRSGAALNGQSELTALRNISVDGDLSAGHVLSLSAQGEINLGGGLSDSGYTTLNGVGGVSVAGEVNAVAAVCAVDGVNQELRIVSGSDIAIGCLLATGKTTVVESRYGSIVLHGFGVADTTASLLAPNGSITAALSADSSRWNYARVHNGTLAAEAQGDILLAVGDSDKALNITGEGCRLALRSANGTVRMGDVNVNLSGDGVIEIPSDAQLRSYTQRTGQSEGAHMTLSVGGDLSVGEYVSYGLTDVSVAGAFNAASVKAAYSGESSISASSVTVGDAASSRGGILLLKAADFVDITTLSPCGRATVITALRQLGSISVTDGNLDAALSFTVEQGDIRMESMQINGLSTDGELTDEEIRQAVKTPTVLLRAKSGSLLIGRMSINDNVNLLLDAAVDIGSAQTPLKLSAYSGSYCLELQKHSFLWGRNLYLDYFYDVHNPQGGGNLYPELRLTQSDGDRGVYLKSFLNPITVINEGSLTGSIRSNAPICVTSTHGSIGAPGAALETDLCRLRMVGESVRLSADASGDVYLHALGNLGPQNIRAGGVVDITVDGILDVPAPEQGGDEYSVTALKNDVRISVNGEYAHSAKQPALLVNGSTASGPPLRITLSSPYGGVRTGFTGDIELYLIERGLNDYYTADIRTDGRVDVFHKDLDGESGRVYLSGDINANNGIAISSDGTLTLCCGLYSAQGGISAQGANIELWRGAPLGTGDSGNGDVTFNSDGDISFIIMTHVYSETEKHLSELSVAGDMKLKARGKVALTALLKNSSTLTARSLTVDTLGDIELMGELWFDGDVTLNTSGNVGLLAYKGTFVDHEGGETSIELPLRLTAQGDIFLSADGSVRTGSVDGINRPVWSDAYGFNNTFVRSEGGSISAEAGADLTVGTLVSSKGNVDLSSGGVTTVGTAAASGKLSLTGPEGVTAVHREDGKASLSAAEFAFSTRGTLADNEGDYLLIQHSGAVILPVGISGADCDTVVMLRALDPAGQSVGVVLSGSAYADRDTLLITDAAQLASALGAEVVGGIVRLKKDAALNRALSVVLAKGVSVTLDLNGKTLTLSGAAADIAALSLGGDGRLTVKNGLLRSSSGVGPAIFAVSGTLELTDGAAVENLGGGTVVQLLGATAHITAGARSTRLNSVGGTLLSAGEYASVNMTHTQHRTQELTMGDRKLYVRPDGMLAALNNPAAVLQLTDELLGCQSALWREIADNSYIIGLSHEDMRGSETLPVLTAFSLDSFSAVTLTAQQYSLVYEKFENGVWTEHSGAPDCTELGSYRLTVRPNGILFESGAAEVCFRVLTAGSSGVRIENMTRFVLRGSTEEFTPVAVGLQPGDVLYYQIGGGTPMTGLTFGYADYDAASPATEVLYTVLRGGALYDGGSFTFTLIDLSDCSDIYYDDFTVEYEHYTDDQVLPYSGNIVLETPKRVALKLYNTNRNASRTVEFTPEMIDYYLAPTAYSINYDVSGGGAVGWVSLAEVLHLQPGETAIYSICSTCGKFQRDCTCAPGEQNLTAYASHVEYGHTPRCTSGGECMCGYCGVTDIEKCKELFGNGFALCGDTSCSDGACSHAHYEHYYLSAYSSFDSAASAYLRDKLNSSQFGFMRVHIKSSDVQQSDWEVLPAAAHIAGRGAVDLSDYVSFPGGNSSDFQLRYELRNDANGELVSPDDLAVGSYTATLWLTSDLYTPPAEKKNVSITVVTEQDFIRVFLYDETRSQELDDNFEADGYTGYERTAGSDQPGYTSFMVVARFAEGAPGTYTRFTINYEDLSHDLCRLESVLFSLDGTDYKPLNELDFGFDVTGLGANGNYDSAELYYKMAGSYDGLPVSTTGSFSMLVFPMNLEALVAGPGVNPGETPVFTFKYGPNDTMLHACSNHSADLGEALIYNIPTIAEWGDYRLTPDKLDVVFGWIDFDNPDEPRVEYSGEPGTRLEGQAVEYVRISVKGDSHFERCMRMNDSAGDPTLFRYSRLPYGSDGTNPGSVSFELDGDWQSADTAIGWNDWRDSSSAYSPSDSALKLERVTYSSVSDDTLLITPDLLDGYSTDLFNGTGSRNAAIQSAFAAAGLTKLRWSVVTDYYSYDGIKLRQSSESVSDSGEFDVTADTDAQQLSVSVPGLNRSGVYAVRVLFTGYDSSGSELFTLRGVQTVLTPEAVPVSVPSGMEYYYDQRGDAAIPGVETEEFRKDFDVSYAYEQIDPLTGAAAGALLSGLSEFPALPGDKLRDTAYRVYLSLSPRTPAHVTPVVSELSGYSADGVFPADEWNRAYAQYLDALSQTVSTRYSATTLETTVTIRSIPVTDIRDVSVSGYEGRADGRTHGVTVEGLLIRDGVVQDTVRLTVKNASGNILAGFDNVALSALSGVSVDNGSVLVPLLSATNRESYTVSVTVERGEGYNPFTADATLRLLSGDTVKGVDKEHVFDGEAHSIELTGLAGDGADIGAASVSGWWTDDPTAVSAAQPSFTQPGVYTIHFNATRQVLGVSESYTGSATLTILPFDVSAAGWAGDFGGNGHSVTLNRIDWANDTVLYNGVPVTGEAELPQFTDVGSHSVTLSVTRGNVTRSLTATVDISPLSLSGITAGDVLAYGDGTAEFHITVTGAPVGAVITYFDADGNALPGNPGFSAVGVHTVGYEVALPNYKTYSGRASVEIRQLNGVTAADYEGDWDGKEHSITLYGTTPEDTVYYRTGTSGAQTQTNPVFVDPGSYTVYYSVGGYEKKPINGAETDVWISRAEGSAVVVLRAAQSPAFDAEVYEGEYDGQEHAAVTVTGDLSGVSVQYFDSNGARLSGAPTVKNAGRHTFTVRLVDKNGNTLFTKAVESVIEPKALEWDTGALTLNNIVKAYDGSRGVSGALGTLRISGALAGDNVTLSYSSGIARLLSDELGSAVPALITFEQASLDNANYILPGEAAFTFFVRHIPQLNEAVAPAAAAYTGQQLKPAVIIPELKEGLDYEITGYGDNVNAGQGQVYIQGLGALSGTALTLSFNITAAALPQGDAIGAQYYTGGPVLPAPSIPGLVRGTDFTVQYVNNVDLGTASVTLTGIGNYTGKQTLTFEIVQGAPIPAAPAQGNNAPTVPQLVTDPDGGTAAYEQQSITLPRTGDGAASLMLLLKALPEQGEAGQSLYEARTLRLSRNNIEELIRQGYTSVCFMLGDVAVFIDLNALTLGDYGCTIEPTEEGDGYRLSFTQDNEQVDTLPAGITLAFATEDTQSAGRSMYKLDANGDETRIDAAYTQGQYGPELPALYTAQVDSAGVYRLSEPQP